MSDSANAKKVVERYLDAWKRVDFANARTHLHDDVEFTGPIDRFHSADEFTNTVKNRLGPILKTIHIKKLFVEGNDVNAIYDFETSTPIGTTTISEWFTVKGDKIKSIRIFFDPTPFIKHFTQAAGAR